MRLDELQAIVEDHGIIFLAYGSSLTQDIIASIASGLEKNQEFSELGLGFSSDIFTVFVEVAQNMMFYGRRHPELQSGEGIIVIGRDAEGNYYVHSRNTITADDKTLIGDKLNTIQSMNRDEIRQMYRQLRKNGAHAHDAGAGIGFYEIARRCDRIEHAFSAAENGLFHYVFKSWLYARGGKS